MHDTAQFGPICTLHRLNRRHLLRVEAQLTEHARTQPVTVVLPCHWEDCLQPTFRRIIHELSGAKWLHEVLVSINGFRGDPGEEKFLTTLFQPLPCSWRILWNEGEPRGKGRNLAAAVHQASGAVIAFQDADVRSFRRVDLARLVLPCVHPQMQFRFAKAYYARVTDRLYGRLTRLLVTPLLSTLQQLCGPDPALEFLSAFRYPLAGECCLHRTLAKQIRWVTGYGVEIQILLEVWAHTSSIAVCQVDGGTGYDHRHHDWAKLAVNSRAIIDPLLRRWPMLPPELLLRTYTQEAQQHARHARALAQLNHFSTNDEEEHTLIRLFTQTIQATLAATDL